MRISFLVLLVVVNGKLDGGQCTLLKFLKTEQLDAVVNMVSKGEVDANFRDSYGITPLMIVRRCQEKYGFGKWLEPVLYFLHEIFIYLYFVILLF